MTDQQTIAVYDAQVNAYEELLSKQSADPNLVEFIKLIQPGGFVLDLGCGPATSSAAMRNAALRVDPIDASGEMVRLANEKYAIGARQAYFLDIINTEVYDGIWANFSLLHASAADFQLILSNLNRALKPAGILHLGMKTGTGTARDKLGRHYTYYSKTELAEHLISAGFTIEQTRTGQGKGLAGLVEPWIMVLCKTSDTPAT